METAVTVTRVAYTFGGWVFGGFARDVIVCNKTMFADVDIMLPLGVCHKHFIKVLRAFYGNELTVHSNQTYLEGMYMDKKIIRRIFQIGRAHV